MSNSTESPFSLTLKVGPRGDLLTGRADTVQEMQTRIAELISLAALIDGSPSPAQSAVLDTPPTWAAQSAWDEHQAAVSAVTQAGLQPTVLAQGPGPQAIEEKFDQYGNRFVKGQPVGTPCMHGPRVLANKTSKAGKPYVAYVCVNDSPFGDYKMGKCQQEYPQRG